MNREEYMKNIKPAMDQVMAYCQREKIPFFCAFPVEGEEEMEYEVTRLTPGVLDTRLVPDRITPMLNVMNGFETIPPHEEIVINLDELLPLRK